MARRLYHIVFLLVLLLLPLGTPLVAATPCAPEKTPTLNVTPLRAVFEATLNGTIRTENATLGAIVLSGGNVTLTNTSFLLTPLAESHRLEVLFYAIHDGCVAASIGNYDVARLPTITATPIEERLNIAEAKSVRFVASTDAEKMSWMLDRRIVQTQNNAFLYKPDYNSAGTHRIIFLAKNTQNMSANKTWIVVVDDVNRRPFVNRGFASLTLPIDGSYTIKLSDHFSDSDGDALSFSAKANDGINLTMDGALLQITGIKAGSGTIEVSGKDGKGEEATANITYTTKEKRLGTHLFCGDMICVGPEDCLSCSQDCGACNTQPCTPQWICEEWGACLPTEYQFRECHVVNGCEEPSTPPPEAQRCGYTPRCDDRLKNGRERGVDCGGPCTPCPNCYDGLQNGGEEGVDCGGPCTPCPRCDDGVKNGDETDVDCGGPVCERCEIGKRCFRDADCGGNSCGEGRCAAPSCEDRVQNQGEEGVDCGGPCTPCPRCDDNERNGNEEGIDCGGRCGPCPNCDDGVENQGETFPDCGGPCRSCTFKDVLPGSLQTGDIVLLLIGFVVLVYFLHTLFNSRLVFLVKYGKIIHFFYEDQATYWLVRSWTSFARHLRRPRVAIRGMVDESYREIESLGRIPEELQRRVLIAKLRSLYAAMFGLGADFTIQALVDAVKKSDLPFGVRVIVLRNTKTLELLETTKLHDNVTTAREEALCGLDELRKGL